MASLYRQALESWLKEIEIDCDTVVDVAAGDRPAMTRIKSCQYKEYYTVDKERKFRPDYWHDLNYFKDYKDTPWAKQVDVIFCLELAEYLWNPVTTMFVLNNWLRSGGTLYMSFPFAYPPHSPLNNDYLRYTRSWIERVMLERWHKTPTSAPQKLPMAMWSDFEIVPRLATKGAGALIEFYSKEKMHIAKEASPEVVRATGWLLKARK